MKSRLFGGLLVLLMALGCGRQDRFEITAPGQLAIGTDGPMWDVQIIEGPAFSSTVPPATYHDGQWLMAAINGRIFQVQENSYQALGGQPQEITSAGSLLTTPDGDLWVLASSAGPLWHRDGQGWDSIDLPSGYWERGGLFCDPQGRIFAYEGSNGLHVLTDSGSWERELPVEDVMVRALSMTPEGQPVLLGSGLELVRQGEEGWVIGPPLLDTSFSLYTFAAGAEGRWAATYHLDGTEWMVADFGQGVEFYPQNTSLEGLFWWEGQLLAYQGISRQLLAWAEGGWQMVQDLSDLEMVSGSVRCLPRPEGVMLVFGRGGAAFFDGDTVEAFCPAIGSQVGATFHMGLPHILTNNGYHLRLREGIWEILGRPVEEVYLFFGRHLFPDPGGGLAIVSGDTWTHWDEAGGHVALPHQDYFEQTFPQADGSLLIEGQYQIWHYTAAGLENLGPSPSGSLVGAVLSADNRVYLAQEESLEVMENGTLRTLAYYPREDIGGLVEFPGEGVFLLGFDRFVSVGAETYRDLTPVWKDDGGIEQVWLVGAVADGRGGVLVLDSEESSVLRLDAGRWEVVDSTVWRSLDRPRFLRRSAEGHLFFFNGGSLGLFREVGP